MKPLARWNLLPIAALAMACGPLEEEAVEDPSCEPLSDDIVFDTYEVYSDVLEEWWIDPDVGSIVVQWNTRISLSPSGWYPFPRPEVVRPLSEHPLVPALHEANPESFRHEAHFTASVPVHLVGTAELQLLAEDGRELFERRLEQLYGTTLGAFVFSRPGFNCTRTRALVWVKRQVDASGCYDDELVFEVALERGTWRIVRGYADTRRPFC